MRLLLQRVVRDLGEAVYQLNLCLVPLLSSYCGSMEGDYRLQVLDLSELFLVKVSGADGSLGVAHVGERSVFSFLVDVVHRLGVLLLVVDEGAAVRPGPAALVALIRVFPGVTTSVVDQIIRSLELLPTEVAGVTKLSLVDQLVLL